MGMVFCVYTCSVYKVLGVFIDLMNSVQSTDGTQGFIQDFSTRGGGSSISATVQPPTLHEVGGGGDYASTDLIGPVGSARLMLQFMAVR